MLDIQGRGFAQAHSHPLLIATFLKIEYYLFTYHSEYMIEYFQLHALFTHTFHYSDLISKCH